MVSFTLNLCGKNIECSESIGVEDDEITDPDIAGIGILVSFILPSIAAIVAFALAWIKRRIPQQQYNCIDDMAWSWLRRGPPGSGSAWATASEVSGYQNFILLVNDQMLLTGLGLTIAIYSQICSISMFSFHVACNLAYLCSTVHLATLTVLRVPFKESTRAQRNLRVSLMILGLTGILVSKFLQYSTWCVNYYQSIVTDVAPRQPVPNSNAPEKPISSWVLAALKKLHNYPGAQGDIDTSLDEMQEKNRASCLKRLASLITTINQSRSGQIPGARLLRAVFVNVGFDVLIELQNSIVYDLFLCTFWFALAITDLINSLKHGGADIKPLLEWKFGQVLPIILLLSYALTALGIEPSSRKTKKNLAVVDKSPNMASPENLSHDDPVSSDSEVDLGTSPGMVIRSFTNTGFSSQNEDPRSRPTRRVNTVELERAIVTRRTKRKPRSQTQRPILDPKDYITQPIDLIDLSRREAQGYIDIVVTVAFIFLVGFLVQMYFWFRETVTALTGLYIILFLDRVVGGSLAIRRIKSERLRRERAATSERESDGHFGQLREEQQGTVNPWMQLRITR
ncbi:hypothetical protein QBC41DRAFT_356042 [Cercophora samala]|uniref:Uncharacterized protein n=1 Tax=Cercophora samala TaxID=330535 RepID=A0AA39ZE13_9PEZI|nr:hypothetical protein QBC41DRAFT_356042 [Cercophora samala]